MQLKDNALVALPRELGRLHALVRLDVTDNRLTSVPSELGHLPALETLLLDNNKLTWLPLSLDRLSRLARVLANDNPFPIQLERGDLRYHLQLLYSATTALAMIREQATAIAVGLQELELPALVTLEIIDAALPNNAITMFKKWQLVVTVKHFPVKAKKE